MKKTTLPLKTRLVCGTTSNPQSDEVNFNPQVLPSLDQVNGLHVATLCAVASGSNTDVIKSAERETCGRNNLTVAPEMKILATCPTSALVRDQSTPCSPLSLTSFDVTALAAAEFRSDQKDSDVRCCTTHIC